jgi:SAM-dependent methyltransferase
MHGPVMSVTIFGENIMAFYDYFDGPDRQITGLGRRIVQRAISKHIALIERFLTTTTVPRVLEIGPGKGLFARAVAGRGWEYVGVDCSPALVKRLTAEHIPVFFSAVPPIPDAVGNKFDVIMLEELIEHMSSAETAKQLVEDAYHRLSEGGLLIVISPDFLTQGPNFFDCDYTHSYVTTSRRLHQLLTDSGFSIRYQGYEALSVTSNIVTLVMTVGTRILFASGLPTALGRALGKEERMEKIKFSLLRSCLIVGQRL